MHSARLAASQGKRARARRWARGALASIVVLSALAGAGQARAGEEDSAVADALFQAAKKLAAQKNYADACPKFEASYKLDPTLGTLLNLADCNENIGKIASAWSLWGEAEEKATRAADERASFAKGRRDALTERLPKLVVQVSHPAEELELHMDDVKLDPAVFGIPLPVDPGKHVIVVLRGDERIHEQPVELAEKESKTVELDLEAIGKAHPEQEATAKPPPSPAAAPAGGGTQKKVGLVVGGVGVGVVLLAAGLEIGALLKKGAANKSDACYEKVCAPAGFKAVEDARVLATAGQWVGVGGLVVTAVGATLFLTAPSAERKPAPVQTTARSLLQSAWILPWATAQGGGVVLGGRL